MSEQQSLYDLTFQAIRAVETCSNPDLTEWVAAIDPVLLAAGLPTVGTDRVSSLFIAVDELYVSTLYSIQGRPYASNFLLALSILKADHPLRAAKEFRLSRELRKALRELNFAKSSIERLTETVDKLTQELDKLREDSNESETQNADQGT